jgi:hypothetical protein
MELIDYAGLCRTIDAYSRLLDEGESDRWLELFCEDGRLVVGDRVFEGHLGLRRFLDGRRGGGLHLNTLPAFRELGPDDVAAEVPFFGLKQGTEGLVLSGAGRYHDHLRRRDERWSFVERRVAIAEL